MWCTLWCTENHIRDHALYSTYIYTVLWCCDTRGGNMYNVPSTFEMPLAAWKRSPREVGVVHDEALHRRIPGPILCITAMMIPWSLPFPSLPLRRDTVVKHYSTVQYMLHDAVVAVISVISSGRATPAPCDLLMSELHVIKTYTILCSSNVGRRYL